MPLTASPTEIHGCPGLALLSEFDLGKLSGPESERILEHLSSCAECEAVLHGLQGQATEDGVVSWLKRCLGNPGWDEPAYVELTQSAQTVQAAFLQNGLLVEIRGVGPTAATRRPAKPALDKYELLEEIGHGGMGVVYRARHVSLDRIVAVKMISAGRYASPRSLARFTREGRALARLQHQNVVKVHDFDIHDGLPYLAMELMDGGSLLAKLSAGPLAPKEAAELVRTLARVADFMHRKGIVHRDLKPANILLDRDGTPKISDFGLVKLLDVESEGLQSPHLTDSGTLLGTVNYMAPEQLFATSAAMGPSIDIYALGAILYESLTGRPPFSDPNRLKVMDMVRTKQPVLPSRVRSDVPAWLEEVCLKCLEKTPELRYPTAEALAVDLDRWLADEPTPTTIRRAARVWRRVRRPGAVALACAVPLLALALGVGRGDPDRMLRQQQAELARGQAVSLIGKTGPPKWYRWSAGEARAKLTLAADDTTSVQSLGTSLVELLPDPGSDRYRITGQVRHDQSDSSGEVGLYLAHRTHPIDRRKYQLFLQVAFNAVRSTAADVRARLPIEFRPKKTPINNTVKLRPHILAESAEGLAFNSSLHSIVGSGIRPLGEENGQWQNLEVIVTPEELTVSWNGEAFSAKVAELQEYLDHDLGDSAAVGPGAPPEMLRPRIDLRGGLGLYVVHGRASFRSFSIHPF
jgi:serine/threonine-protein kinase